MRHLLDIAKLSAPLPNYARRLENLLGDQFERIQRTDKKDRLTKPLSDRHRLAVLTHVVQEWENGRISPKVWPVTAFSELLATIRILETAQFDPTWPRLLTSVHDRTEYAHTLVLLALTRHLRAGGMPAELKAEGVQRSCDLCVPFEGGVVNLELKIPRKLLWEVEPLKPADAAGHIRKEFHSARTGSKGQLPPPNPGILAIGGLSFSERTRDMLIAAARKYFERLPGDYSHVMGTLFVWIGSRIGLAPPMINGDQFSLTSSVDTLTQIEFVQNPTYSGSVFWRLTDNAVTLY